MPVLSGQDDYRNPGDYTHHNGVTSESEHQSLEHPPSVRQLRTLIPHTDEVLADFCR